ncbi:MAG: hydrogenase iron-sulfur subunit, partial [Methanobacteriota archaeon]
LLEGIGVDPSRLRLEWVSASEGPIFAELVREFSEEIRKLGPNPLKEKVTISSKEEGGEEIAQV